MANTYKEVVIDGDVDNGGGGGNSTPYIGNFTTVDWSLELSDYVMTIFQATHAKGAHVQCEVYQAIGGGLFEEVILDIEVNTQGDVKIKVSSSPDLRFNGYVNIL
jgi:hypothetical protein